MSGLSSLILNVASFNPEKWMKSSQIILSASYIRRYIAQTQHPHHLYADTADHTLTFISANVVTTMVYTNRKVPMYDFTTDSANHATKIGPRWQVRKRWFSFLKKSQDMADY